MKSIQTQAKTIGDILEGKRYAIDYYQREYRWQRKHVAGLFEDLADEFLAHYRPDHRRRAVVNYGHYFLGSIILCEHDGEVFIVDGQQRLTTLTLLLILLHRLQGTRPGRVNLESKIYVEKHNERTFNIAVPERASAMETLFNGKTPDVTSASESVQTIVARYEDLDDLLSHSEVDEHALPYFCEWLTDNVHFVEIVAATDEDAYTIFETMNDRGLSLSPLDMLKGFLLANIGDPERRNLAASVWRKNMESLRRIGKEEDSDAVKAWLRGRHAQSVRERKRGSDNQDFEKIGTEFHRWVNTHQAELGLQTDSGVFALTHDELPFYLHQYERLRRAAMRPAPGLESVYHVACFNFTLQYPILLASLERSDSPPVIDRKIRLVSKYLDILLARRAVNYLSLTYSALNYTLFGVMKRLRGMPLSDQAVYLTESLKNQDCDFNGAKDGARKGIDQFALNQWSKRYIKVLLARITAWVEEQSGQPSSVDKYMADGQGRYEVEHIWADKPDLFRREFESPADFENFRNRFGGLLLLPKSFNASYGDLPYHQKIPHYLSQNLLARSLHPQCYDRHPGFLRFVAESNLPFSSHSDFNKADLEARCELYHRISDRIWNLADLANEVIS